MDTTATLPRIHDLCKPTICCRGVHYTITNESDCLYGRLQYHTHTLLSSQGLMCTMDEVTESTAELLSPTLNDLNAPSPAYTHTNTHAHTMNPVHCPQRPATSNHAETPELRHTCCPSASGSAFTTCECTDTQIFTLGNFFLFSFFLQNE